MMNKIVSCLIFFSQACLLYVSIGGAHPHFSASQDMIVYDCEVISEINNGEINNLEPDSSYTLVEDIKLERLDVKTTKLTILSSLANHCYLYFSDGLIRGPPTFSQA